ncbi:dienelactone hydrolase family protein [Georgenia alba]|uniref:Dienelactone hydrolase family protein n=1 Tax=Georgenia alba TaxID=2233858 RepID=A0ABW2Q423_9MICO
MPARPSAIGGYEDWPGWLRGRELHDGDETTRAVARLLGVPRPEPAHVRTAGAWEQDGVEVTELHWSVGFGPPTRAWALRPAGTAGPLPGVLALHCHGGVKSVGAAELLRTPADPAVAQRARRDLYGGRALAKDLARAGFAVLAHDTFGWGARRFTLDPPPSGVQSALAGAEALWAATGTTPAPAELADTRYDAAAAAHEHVVAKAAGYLGTTFAGMVAYDDLVALGVLRGLDGVDADRTAVVGMSGGGGRAAQLAALDPRLTAAVVVAMMTTTQALFPAHVDAHSWLLASPLGPDWGLPRLAAGRRRHDLMVLSFDQDELFPSEGVRDAHRELRERYAEPGSAALEEAILPGPHAFPPEAQDRAVEFLVRSLR